MFENNKWYVAYAYHHWASPRDIQSDSTSYDTYEEALASANEMLCDDDDAEVYYRNNNEWYRWWGKKEELVTEKEWYRRFAEEFPNPCKKED